MNLQSSKVYLLGKPMLVPGDLTKRAAAGVWARAQRDGRKSISWKRWKGPQDKPAGMIISSIAGLICLYLRYNLYSTRRSLTGACEKLYLVAGATFRLKS